jgi:hypothetical protein
MVSEYNDAAELICSTTENKENCFFLLLSRKHANHQPVNRYD